MFGDESAHLLAIDAVPDLMLPYPAGPIRDAADIEPRQKSENDDPSIVELVELATDADAA
jgi:hypothetical protein